MAKRSRKRLLIPAFCLLLLSHISLTVWYNHKFKYEEETYEKVTKDILRVQRNLSLLNGSDDIQELRRKVPELGRNVVISKQNNFTRSSISPSTVIFVVQVHRRITYLRAVIESLREVRGIEDALVIFSHDIQSEEINRAVQNISFTRWMQIFYPYSMQLSILPLLHQRHPGPDLNGTLAPEQDGRSPPVSQIKLHWVWKLTQVFRDIILLADHTGPKIFLEEDHYVLPHIILTLEKMQQIQAKECPNCLIVLGGYPGESTWKFLNWDVVTWGWFFSSLDNMGMVFDQKFWDLFSLCAEEFCNINDYNWDWTLQHLNNKCFPGKLQVLKPAAPRVIHVGDCGVHTKLKVKCTPLRQADTVRKVQTLVRETKSFSAPEVKVVKKLNVATQKTPDPFGGWTAQDRTLCLNIVKET